MKIPIGFHTALCAQDAYLARSEYTPISRNPISGIPALSRATGRTNTDPAAIANFDMNTNGKPENGLWGRSGEPYTDRWLHSDLREMAFYFTYKLFENLVENGGLQ